MPTFSPPTVADVPRVLPRTRGVAYLLMRHYSPLPRGRSVIWNGTTYVTVDVPDTTGLVEGTTLFLGGHIYDVTDAVAATLIAAGYTVATTEWSELTGTWDSYSNDTWETIA